MKKRIFVALLCSIILCFGMIAASSAQGGGYFAFTVSGPDWLPSYGEGATVEQAEQAAIRACGGSQTCVEQVESAATPTCFAIADSPDWLGWSSRQSYQEAMDVALKECRDQSSNCRIISLECRQ